MFQIFSLFPIPYMLMYKQTEQASVWTVFVVEISESPHSDFSVDGNMLHQLLLMSPLIIVSSLDLLPDHCTYSVGV